MKRKLKILISSILCLSMILSVTACDDSEVAQEPERTTNKEFEDLVEYIGSLSGMVDNDIKVEKKIRWLSWWAIDETQAAAELFKKVYGIPELGDTSYGDDANNIFDYIYCDYEARYDQLGKMVSTGDSPDIFQFEISNFPYTAYKGLFQPIDEYVDLSSSLWDHTREAMKQFQWGGKNYCALTTVNLDDVMWYRRSVVAEAGLDEPYDLYKAGNWTWNTFLDMCDKWQLSGEGKYATDGYRVPEKFVITTGVPLIGIGEDGKLHDNFYDANIERAMTNLIDVLYKEDYRYPRDTLNNWNTSINDWVKGNILFFCELSTSYKDSFQGYIQRYKWENTEIFCVPFPRDPQADKYYQSFKNDSYMLVSGSKNTAGFSAWTQCVIATAYDKETARISREQIKANYDYSDELLDLFDEMQYGDVLTPVFDFKGGIGQDIVNSATVYNPVTMLTEVPYLNCLDEKSEPTTFSKLRDENVGRIRTRIDELNATIG